MSATQRVADAIVIGVRVSLDNAGRVTDRSAFARSVEKRLQGTYGAKLRAMAEDDPALEPVEMFRAVIAPKEFPWESVENPLVIPSARRVQGNRGDALLERWDIRPAEVPGWSEGLAEARRRLKTPSESDREERAEYVAERQAETSAVRGVF